jgi:hypothetical protein
MCYFSIKSGEGGWGGKKWFQGLRRLLCSQPKAKKIGDKVTGDKGTGDKGTGDKVTGGQSNRGTK